MIRVENVRPFGERKRLFPRAAQGLSGSRAGQVGDLEPVLAPVCELVCIFSTQLRHPSVGARVLKEVTWDQKPWPGLTVLPRRFVCKETASIPKVRRKVPAVGVGTGLRPPQREQPWPGWIAAR